MNPQVQRTLGYPSVGSTRRNFILTATAAAASTTVAQKLARAAIVQTDTAKLPPIPLPAGIRSRYVSNINGLTFHVLEAGFEDKGRPCVLLLHGYPELAYAWRKVMLPLASAGFHVLAPDNHFHTGLNRKRGVSIRPPEGGSPEPPECDSLRPSD